MSNELRNMSYGELIEGWNGRGDASTYRNEIRRRAALAGEEMHYHLGVRLGNEIRSGGEPVGRLEEVGSVQLKRIRDISRTLRQIREASSVEEACRALLTCGWDFIDPEGRMSKSPTEVRDFLNSLMKGMPPTWDELIGAHGDRGRQNLLKMIIDAWFRAYE